MKIALISHLFPTELHPFHGKFIKDQLELLQTDSNIQVELIVPTPYSLPFTERNRKNNSILITKAKASRLKYLSFPEKRFPRIIARSISNTITNFIDRSEADVIHIHWLYPDGLVIPALKEMGLKTVLTIHGSDWYQTRNDPVLVDLLESSLTTADRILYSGPLLKDDIEAEYPFLSSKSEIIYNLVDDGNYHPVDDEKKSVLKKGLGWDPSKKHALTVANLRKEKGIDILLEAISSTEDFSDIQFHVIGADDKTDYSKKIRHQIQNTSQADIELMEPVKPHELLKLYQASDLYILPSRREGFNVSILEAMACGLPAVCTDVGGNKLIISDKTGLICPPKNANLLAQGIRSLASALNQFNSTHIHNTIASLYGNKAFLQKLKSIYASLYTDSSR